jgi:hypothetical protein
MGKNPKPKPDDPAQSERFIEAAKKAEADESPGAFERVFKKIVPAKDSKSPSSK